MYRTVTGNSWPSLPLSFLRSPVLISFPLSILARISHCYTLRCLRSSKSREDVNQSTDDANLRQSRRDKMNVKIGSMSIHLINDDANFDPKRGSSNSGHAAAQARLAYNNDGSTRYIDRPPPSLSLGPSLSEARGPRSRKPPRSFALLGSYIGRTSTVFQTLIHWHD